MFQVCYFLGNHGKEAWFIAFSSHFLGCKKRAICFKKNVFWVYPFGDFAEFMIFGVGDCSVERDFKA